MTNSLSIMLEAIKCAEEGRSLGEVPVGAVIYCPKTLSLIHI